MFKIGIGVLISGFLLMTAGMIIGNIGWTMDEDEVILTETDLNELTKGVYTQEMDVAAIDAVGISIRSKFNDAIGARIIIKDEDGANVFTNDFLTPYDTNVKVGPGVSSFYVTLEFHNRSYSNDDIEFEITKSTVSEQGALLCCGAMVLPVLGVLFLIVGLIMVIVGAVIKKGGGPPAPLTSEPRPIPASQVRKKELRAEPVFDPGILSRSPKRVDEREPRPRLAPEPPKL